MSKILFLLSMFASPIAMAFQVGQIVVHDGSNGQSIGSNDYQKYKITKIWTNPKLSLFELTSLDGNFTFETHNGHSLHSQASRCMTQTWTNLESYLEVCEGHEMAIIPPGGTGCTYQLKAFWRSEASHETYLTKHTVAELQSVDKPEPSLLLWDFTRGDLFIKLNVSSVPTGFKMCTHLHQSISENVFYRPIDSNNSNEICLNDKTLNPKGSVTGIFENSNRLINVQITTLSGKKYRLPIYVFK